MVYPNDIPSMTTGCATPIQAMGNAVDLGMEAPKPQKKVRASRFWDGFGTGVPWLMGNHGWFVYLVLSWLDHGLIMVWSCHGFIMVCMKCVFSPRFLNKTSQN